MIKSIISCLDRLKSTNSSKEKLKILSEYKDDIDVRDFFFHVYEPSISYYIKNISFSEYEEESILSNEFDFAYLYPIKEREATGHVARDYLIELYKSFDNDSRRILKLIIDRDVRCGISVSTINKVWPGLITKPSYMRCSLIDGSNMNKWDWSKGVYVQEKMDGMFCRLSIEDCDIEMSTRAGNIISLDNKAMQNINANFSKFKSSSYEGYQWHGELVVYRSNMMLSRKEGNGILNSIIQGDYSGECIVDFIVWDVIENEQTKSSYKDRFSHLKKLQNISNFSMCNTDIVHSLSDLDLLYKKYLKAGSEGIVAKYSDMVWKDGTSKDMVKYKVEKEVDLKVIGFNEGKGKNANTFGSLICVSSDERLLVNVSGFTDDMREKIASDFEFYKNKIVSVRANSLIDSNGKDEYSLFLPRFIEFRFNEKTEANSIDEIKSIFVV